MSLMPIEEVKRLDPHIDPIDVSRLMFRGVLEGLKPGPSEVRSALKKEPFPDPLTFLVGSVFLILTVPLGGIAEGVAVTYSKIKQEAK